MITPPPSREYSRNMLMNDRHEKRFGEVNTKKINTKKDPEVVNTKKDPEVVNTKKKPEVTTTKKDPEVACDL